MKTEEINEDVELDLAPYRPVNAVKLQADMVKMYNNGTRSELLSFDPTTPKGAAMLVTATLGKPVSIKKMLNQTIAITDFYAGPASKTLEDGEVEEWARIVLFTDDGKAISCGARGVAKSLAVLLRVRPLLPWNPPIIVRPDLEELKDGKIWITLQPDMSQLLPGPDGE